MCEYKIYPGYECNQGFGGLLFCPFFLFFCSYLCCNSCFELSACAFALLFHLCFIDIVTLFTTTPSLTMSSIEAAKYSGATTTADTNFLNRLEYVSYCS